MIYLDNAATSYPKPKKVIKAVNQCLKTTSVNLNRSVYDSDFDVLEKVYETRELIGELVNFKKTENIIFTANATTSINILTKGYLNKGDHVIISSFEHNAVLRAVNSVEGVEVTVLEPSKADILETALLNEIKNNTKLVIAIHASNVTGEVFDLSSYKNICQKHDLRFIVDASQTLGAYPVDMNDLGADALVFTGHKCLLGMQGIGGFVITDEFSKEVKPLICGGTGESSLSQEQPEVLPSKYEAGTLNLPAIYSLHAGVGFLMERGIKSIQEHKRLLSDLFRGAFEKSEKVKIVRFDEKNDNVGIVALDIIQKDNNMVADTLYEKYKIKTRSGLHCSPLAHEALNTVGSNLIRFSFGVFNSKKDVFKAIKAINEIIGDSVES